MGIISVFLGSSAFMWLIAFVCAVFCIRCLLYGMLGGTSMVIRIAGTVLFACLAYYCYQHAIALHGPNAIDNFVYGSLADVKHFFRMILSKF